jgi:type IV fimbrial biogenesis protein FimT
VRNDRPATVNNTKAGFIYGLKPFICLNKPLVEPFIPINRPSIGNKRNNGFTLIELMVTLALAAIIAFVAVPNMSNFVLSSKIKNRTSELVSAIGLARSAAIKNKAPAILCVGTATTCSGTDWGAGWVAWLDSDGDSVFDSGSPDNEPMLYVAELSAGDKATINFASSSLRIRPDGTIATAVTIDICDSSRSGEQGRRISINITGRTSVSKRTCT